MQQKSGKAEHPEVIVQRPKVQAMEIPLVLPASVLPLRQTTLYAQTAGYLKTWLVDIGDRVKEGQLLAEIDTPQVDQQLAQAKASMDQATANLEIAQESATRWQELLKTHAVSQQDTDQKVSTAKAKAADLAAAKANVEQFADLQRFKRIVAPFDGTITARYVEIGALISVGSSPTQIFQITQNDPMRVMVNVPQAYMRSITLNLEGALVTREYQNRRFPGTVTRTSRAIDVSSRTLLTEVTIPNRDQALLPGMYAQVEFKLKNPQPAVLIPASALIIRAAGPMVAIVDSNHQYRYRKVQLGHDFGEQLEITSGITSDDQVVITPADVLTEGMVVSPKEEKEP